MDIWSPVIPTSNLPNTCQPYYFWTILSIQSNGVRRRFSFLIGPSILSLQLQNMQGSRGYKVLYFS